MKTIDKNAMHILIIIIILWIGSSVLLSATITEQKLCNKDYPLNYIFYTKLFCELPHKNNR